MHKFLHLTKKFPNKKFSKPKIFRHILNLFSFKTASRFLTLHLTLFARFFRLHNFLFALPSDTMSGICVINAMDDDAKIFENRQKNLKCGAIEKMRKNVKVKD